MYGSGFAGPPKTVLRARGTLFWPKLTRELTKYNGTGTIRSEIARGIVSNRSQGPEMDKIRVFDTPTCMEVFSHPPDTIILKGSLAKKNSESRSDFDFVFVRDPFTEPFHSSQSFSHI